MKWMARVACVLGLAAGCESGGQGVGSQAPEFSLTSLDGKQVSLSSLRQKTILLTFWAVG